MQATQSSAVFKPRARMLLLLGDQLIRDPGLAVFELVKNAYDADATICSVTLKNLDDPANGQIIVEDNDLDRKSTRLNSSHTVISYAVFCLKKKTITLEH